MGRKTFIRRIVVFLCLQFAINQALWAQQNNCIFKEPLLIIDFGAGKDIKDINQSPLPKYNRVFNDCPADGNYSFVSHTSECFRGDWHTFNQDHTLNDKDGKMMLVNASETGGVFLNITINGLEGRNNLSIFSKYGKRVYNQGWMSTFTTLYQY
jgi:hypothetical protein